MFGYRTPQQVTERLDRLIKEIRDIQRPHMDGSKAVDVVVVSVCNLIAVQYATGLMGLGGTWHESEVLRQEVVGVPARHAAGVDVIARRDWHPQVSTSLSIEPAI
jgi:hypothetical protein